MIRQIFLDTETTGLETRDGHRIIEIGCVEMVDRKLTNNNYHQYIKPDRESDEEALAVHGITTEFLADKPRFNEIAVDFLEYVKGAELIIHNAPFDIGFLNYELSLLSSGVAGGIQDLATICEISDSLVQARQLHPGQRNSLDALCKRYMISNDHRQLHGALLDSEILADVYLAMTGGQTALLLGGEGSSDAEVSAKSFSRLDSKRQPFAVIKADANELDSHQKYLQKIQDESGKTLWDSY
ncbi:DNA polymerase III subunit epsilon [uncultured Cocleimonas sp.]|uniref:DNA polymerase III subunit epsilon n=1 Tax=uncultured Cocleimonas sp. TaxID=1051587 RepID=UPI002631939F|nr:DNA polymerase III subunit epsilon [uncultured Cocleimonas sp.]